MESGVSGRDRTLAALAIQERLAEARHNEVFGWGTVVLSAFLVITLTIASSIPAAIGSAVVGVAPIAVLQGGVMLGGLDLTAGMMLLAAVLVALGVAVALYCRFVRTRLFDELAFALEVAAAVESMRDETEV